MQKKPLLVVLAAGMGSRYGGLKQMDKIGAGGEVLLDYSVFDALRAGFGRVVFVIRRDIERDFHEIVLKRMGARVLCDTAFQELGSLLPPEIARAAKANGRTKPWGTTHALLCAGDKIDAPFAVINADDFYGKESYEVMAAYLAAGPADGAIVPYRLSQVLSPSGTVTRGICEVQGGYLRSVNELLKIQREGDGIYNTNPDGVKQRLSPDAPVSMNFFGYPESIIPHFRRYFDEFLQSHGNEEKSECYLPLAADAFIKSGKTAIRVLDADSEWFGVTYKEDREAAAARVAQLTKDGVYPPRLWA
ncbi:MAG: NTP transferase domain-containing protein [Spirochaetaceae bacterium]|jgi:hypothetical protein|nr:NTP transferase domain-containing protein [Spirochaetaceae bacterium]